MPDAMENVTLYNAQLVFKNFAGREGPYNRAGDRSASLLLTDHDAEILKDRGWNVKELKVREEGDTPQKYITFSVRYPGGNDRVRPPVVVLLTSRGRNTLPEEMCEMIDYVDIESVDIVLRPYQWAVNGNTGVKAYLKSLYVKVAEDELAIKYRDVPEIGAAETQAAIDTGSDEEIWDADVVQDDTLAIES
jgi:hypothetical protein